MTCFIEQHPPTRPSHIILSYPFPVSLGSTCTITAQTLAMERVAMMLSLKRRWRKLTVRIWVSYHPLCTPCYHTSLLLGSLMSIAWLLFASTGIFFAMWMKPAFSDGLWFQFHRALMIVAVVTEVAGFICIFIATRKNKIPGLIGFECVSTTATRRVLLCRLAFRQKKLFILFWVYWLLELCWQMWVMSNLIYCNMILHAKLLYMYCVTINCCIFTRSLYWDCFDANLNLQSKCIIPQLHVCLNLLVVAGYSICPMVCWELVLGY